MAGKGASAAGGLVVGNVGPSVDPAGEAELMRAFGNKIAAIQAQAAAAAPPASPERLAAAGLPTILAGPMGNGAPPVVLVDPPVPLEMQVPQAPGPVVGALDAAAERPARIEITPEELAAIRRGPEPTEEDLQFARVPLIPTAELLTELGRRLGELERRAAVSAPEGGLALTNRERNQLVVLLDLPSLQRGGELVAAVARAVSVDMGGVDFPFTPQELEILRERARMAGRDFKVWIGAVFENLKPHILNGSAG